MPSKVNMELRFSGKLHATIKEAIWARYCLSRDKMCDYYTGYKERDEQFIAYMPETDNDALRRGLRKDGKPQYTTIKIPYSYATFLSAHTYWASVFLSRNPVLQYTARHGEPEMSVQAVEALMDYQVQVGRMVASKYIWMHDAGKYGQGIVWNYWEEEEVTVSKMVERPKQYLGIDIPGTSQKVKQTIQMPGYVGNKIFNVKPQDFFPDPRVPITQLQKGEFVARKVDCGWNEVVLKGIQGEYFNLEALERSLKANRGIESDRDEGSEQLNWPEEEEDIQNLGTRDIKDVGFVPLIEMCVRIIPKDWKLGTGERPEMWMFTLANETVVIGARPYGAYHDKFPAFVLPYEIDGYQQHTRGMLETIDPLNNVMDWLINTHFFNVRSSLNNQWVVDPSRIVMKDVTNPSAGKAIRLKEAAYGTDVRSALTQLPVADVTSGHLRDTQIIAEMIQRVSGVTDNIMGMVNAGGRKTATEIRTSSSFGINRLKTTAEWWSAGDWGLLAQVMLQNTQQYYDMERKFKIAGDLTEYSRDSTMIITPESIQGFYDFTPVDGTMPIDRFAQANLWKEILFGLQKMPQIQQQYNMGEIFAWMSQLAGLKNIKKFKINVVPDETLTAEANKGNVVSMSQATPDIAASQNGGQIPGIGRTE